MNSIARMESAMRRFWGKVEKKSDDECWEWKGAKLSHGYGAFNIGVRRISTHRFSWEIHYGEIPPGMLVCHKCDNPPCVNPKHLFLGTDTDNQRDKYLKGRCARGEKNNHAKLTEDDVRKIRELLASGKSARSIAPIFGVRHAAILTIKDRKNWGWLK